MHVRRIRPDEVEAYRELLLRALREAPDAFLASYEEEDALPDAAWHDRAERGALDASAATFVLERPDGRLGGTVHAFLQPAPDRAEVVAMWVDDDLRGGDAADALLDAAEAWAASAGAVRVELAVAHGNERARRFYARHGYVATGEVEVWERGGGSLRYARTLPPRLGER